MSRHSGASCAKMNSFWRDNATVPLLLLLDVHVPGTLTSYPPLCLGSLATLCFFRFFVGFWLFTSCCRDLCIWHALRFRGHDATNGEHPGLRDAVPLSTVSVGFSQQAQGELICVGCMCMGNCNAIHGLIKLQSCKVLFYETS